MATSETTAVEAPTAEGDAHRRLAESENLNLTNANRRLAESENLNLTNANRRLADSENLNLTKANLVAFSSRIIAAARAIESRRPDRLFNDWFAELLAGEEAMRSFKSVQKLSMAYEPGASLNVEAIATSTEPGSNCPKQSADGTDVSAPERDSASRRFALRTRFGDDFFEDCTLPPKSIKQIVSLGAGMDTRGLRLRASAGTTVFEIDQALVLTVKRSILAGATLQTVSAGETLSGVGKARVIGVEADLAQAGWEGKLLQAGFDPALPSAWILEGLTMYLEEQEIERLLQIIAKLCSSGSAFCANCVSAECLELSKKIDNDILRTWKWGSDDPQASFQGFFPAGWSFKCVTYAMPGEFPDGAGYSLGYTGKGAYVIGHAA